MTTKFDRTNINSGTYQMRAMITQVLNKTSALLQNSTYEAVALLVSSPIPYTPSALIPKMSTKIFFRVPVLHSNLPLPATFKPEFKDIISNLKPEDRDQLLISCHPFLYADYDDASSINPGDIIQIKFLDNSFSSANLVVPEASEEGPIQNKSTNTQVLSTKITNFVQSVKDIFDDSGETAILGSDIVVSPQATKLAQVYHTNMKFKSPCQFLADWKAKFDAKLKIAQRDAQNAKKINPDSLAAIQNASDQTGVPYELLLSIARVESGKNFDPLAYNYEKRPSNPGTPTYATGLFQILAPFYVGYGLPPPPPPAQLQKWIVRSNRGGHDAWDPYKNALAVAKRLKQNIDKTTARLGRPPEPWEVYVTHNQGHDTFYIQAVACQLYGPNGGVNELATAIQLIVNNNFNVGVSDPKPKNNTNQNIFFAGTWRTIPKTNEDEWSEGLSSDLPTLKNLIRK